MSTITMNMKHKKAVEFMFFLYIAVIIIAYIIVTLIIEYNDSSEISMYDASVGLAVFRISFIFTFTSLLILFIPLKRFVNNEILYKDINSLRILTRGKLSVFSASVFGVLGTLSSYYANTVLYMNVITPFSILLLLFIRYRMYRDFEKNQ